MFIDFLLRHAVVRRLCSLALLLLLCAVALVLLPLAMLCGGLNALVHGRGGGHARAARFAAFAGAYLAAEVAGLLRSTWMRRTDEDAHYALLTRLLGRLFRTSQRAFRLRIVPPEPNVALPDGPLIVLSRHAGPGDSFLLPYALLTVGRRRPRLVAKETLRFDPLIDVALGRTPNYFVGRCASARAGAADGIGALAATLGPRDALVEFPEGRNFTTARRRRLINRLRRRRDRSALATAASLSHVLPAKPSGAFAAIDAAPPTTHVVFVAHTGLDRIETAAQAWRAVPLRRPVRVAWWSVPVGEIPPDELPRQTWLKEQWARVDSWIDDQPETEKG
jgi:1-acyl-sn-glycerol-3-phosphate acyltransferase